MIGCLAAAYLSCSMSKPLFFDCLFDLLARSRHVVEDIAAFLCQGMYARVECGRPRDEQSTMALFMMAAAFFVLLALTSIMLGRGARDISLSNVLKAALIDQHLSQADRSARLFLYGEKHGQAAQAVEVGDLPRRQGQPDPTIARLLRVHVGSEPRRKGRAQDAAQRIP
jgi:hypothetical protein